MADDKVPIVATVAHGLVIIAHCLVLVTVALQMRLVELGKSTRKSTPSGVLLSELYHHRLMSFTASSNGAEATSTAAASTTLTAKRGFPVTPSQATQPTPPTPTSTPIDGSADANQRHEIDIEALSERLEALHLERPDA